MPVDAPVLAACSRPFAAFCAGKINDSWFTLMC